MEVPSDIGNDTAGDDTPTRHSSKLSLGSSPSVLSVDEEDVDDEGLESDAPGNNTVNNNNGTDLFHQKMATAQGMDDQREKGFFDSSEMQKDDEGALTPKDIANENKDGMDKTRTHTIANGLNEQGDNSHDDDKDTDNLFIGSLPPSTSDLDDINMDHDSASPLSSVPDDFPLSPEIQDDTPLSPTHNIPESTASFLSPSPMTRQQKQQLQAATTSPESSSLSQDTGYLRKRKSFQGDTFSNKTRRRRSRIQNLDRDNKSCSSDTVLGDENNNNNNNNNSGVSYISKSRRVSIIGRNMHNKSASTKPVDDIGTNVETIDEDDNDDDDDDDDDDNKVDQAVTISDKQAPLTSTKHHNSTNLSASLSKTKVAQYDQQPPDTKDNESLPQNTDGNTEEKENTPVTLNRDTNDTSHMDDSSGASSTIRVNPFEGSEKLPTNEDERDDQQQHKEAFDALTHIEVEFASLRNKLYQEKMAELNDEAIMIANGTHPDLVTLMAEIEEKRTRRISTAQAWRKYQHTNFKRQFEGFEYQANVHFISRKSSMRREILAETNGKRWRLEDEQGKLNDPSQKRGNLISDTNALMIQKQSKREETLDLQDMKDVIGFPRAPQVAGLSSQDIRHDLQSLGLGTSEVE